MITEHSADPAGSTDTELDTIEAILRRYPDASGNEVDRVIRFLADAPILKRGRLSSRPGMPERMAQFRKDRKELGPSPLAYIVAGLLVVSVTVIGVLMAG